MKFIKRLKKVVSMYVSMLNERDSRFFVFGSWFGNKFADNPKYLYLYMLTHGERVMWVTKSNIVFSEMKALGLPVCMADSKEGIEACLSAKYVLHCTGIGDVNEDYIGGAVIINLWHGIPLKKIMYDDEITTNLTSLWAMFINAIIYLPYRHNYVVSTSNAVTQIYKHAFRKDKEHILQWGQPRNDCFFDGTLKKKHYYNLEYEKLCVYMPTHRNEGSTFIDITKILDLQALNEVCKRNGTLFLIKKHYYHKNETSVLSQFPYIIDITNETLDTQELLYNTDYLITDYSSCFIDYLLLDRPIIFYAYDYEQYLKNDRELYFNYEDIAPGFIAYDFASFLKVLREVFSGYDEYKEKRRVIRDIFYDKENQHQVSHSIMEKVKKL